MDHRLTVREKMENQNNHQPSNLPPTSDRCDGYLDFICPMYKISSPKKSPQKETEEAANFVQVRLSSDLFRARLN